MIGDPLKFPWRQVLATFASPYMLLDPQSARVCSGSKFSLSEETKVIESVETSYEPMIDREGYDESKTLGCSPEIVQGKADATY